MTWRASAWFGAAAALLSGALFLASLDIGTFGPLALIAPVAVLVYALSAPRWQSVAAAAFVARTIGALGLVWAYHDVLPPIALALWILGHAVGFALIILVMRWIARRAPLWAALTSFPLLATACEFLFGLVSPHGSFGAIGYALVDVLPLLQLASIGGLAALAFCAGLFAMTCAMAVVQPACGRLWVLAPERAVRCAQAGRAHRHRRDQRARVRTQYRRGGNHERLHNSGTRNRRRRGFHCVAGGGVLELAGIERGGRDTLAGRGECSRRAGDRGL
jgi:apolipoprotein N-acyltransferase